MRLTPKRPDSAADVAGSRAGLWRGGALVAALVLYGLFSAPAPAEVGLVEAVVGLLLVVATGWHQPVAVFSGAVLLGPGARRFETIGAVALAGVLWLPLVRGAALVWAARDMVRDVVPLFYLFMPVLLVTPLRSAWPWAVRLLATGLALAGVAFVVRWWAGAGWAFGAIGHRTMPEGALYLLNSPAVLFAALWLPFCAVGLVWPGCAAPGMPKFTPWLRLALAPLFSVAAVLVVAALAGTVHRLALIMIAFSGAVFLVWCARRTLWPVVVVGLGLILLWALVPGDPLSSAVDLVVAKSEQVGVNERANEAAAVLDQAGRSLTALVFGDGWGALIANPAVGGWRVSYTHSFPSYLVLKTGLFGLLLVLCWLATLGPLAVRLARSNPPLALAALPPVAGGLLFHTSFKYLCFGLLLTLVVLAAEEGRWTEAG